MALVGGGGPWGPDKKESEKPADEMKQPVDQNMETSIPEPEKSSEQPRKIDDRGDADKPFITKAEMFTRDCKMCGSGVPHLLVTMDRDTDKVFVHAPFGKRWLMHEMMDAVKREWDKHNAVKGAEDTLK